FCCFVSLLWNTSVLLVFLALGRLRDAQRRDHDGEIFVRKVYWRRFVLQCERHLVTTKTFQRLEQIARIHAHVAARLPTTAFDQPFHATVVRRFEPNADTCW